MDGLVGDLIQWLKTFSIQAPHDTIEDLSDGVAIAEVLNNISPEFFTDSWLSKIRTDVGDNWRLRVSNLKKILKGIVDFNTEILGQQISFQKPDVSAIGEKHHPVELGRLLQLVLGCAVNCDRKQEYIEAIMGLEESVQHVVMNAIQELMVELETPNSYSNDIYCDLNEQLKVLTQDLHSANESKEQITQRCHELDMQVAMLLEEKSNLLSENDKLQERFNNIESFEFEDSSSLAGKRYQQSQQKLELLQDELYKLEMGRDELKGKVENQEKEILDLQQKNDELQKVAEDFQAMKDELDVLRHNSDKVSVYEATIESYKKKLEDLSDLKKQLKISEDKNTQYMQQNLDLKEELKKTTMIKSQLDMYKKQAQELHSRLSEETKRADKTEFENKRLQEKHSSLQQEKERLIVERDSLKESLDELRCMQQQNATSSDEHRSDTMGDSDLLEAIPPQIREKLIRLQQENKILKLNESTNMDKELTVLQSMLDDTRKRENELETDFRLARTRIMELEGQLEDLQANQSAVTKQENSEYKQKLTSALAKLKEADSEIQKKSVIIESLETQIEVSVSKNHALQKHLNKKEEEMKDMDLRYRKYLDKAKNVIKNLNVDPEKNSNANSEFPGLKLKLVENQRKVSNLEKENDKLRTLHDMEAKLITTAFYNLGSQLQRRVGEERLAQVGLGGQSFLSRQRQASSRRLTTPGIPSSVFYDL